MKNHKMITVELTAREITTIMRIVNQRIGWMEKNEEKLGISRQTLHGWYQMFTALERAIEPRWLEDEKGR